MAVLQGALGDTHSTENVIFRWDIRKSRTGKGAIVILPQMGYRHLRRAFKKSLLPYLEEPQIQTTTHGWASVCDCSAPAVTYCPFGEFWIITLKCRTWRARRLGREGVRKWGLTYISESLFKLSQILVKAFRSIYQSYTSITGILSTKNVDSIGVTCYLCE